jgi:hypothetical protein
VTVEPFELTPAVLRSLREDLLLFYTAEARSASAVLSDQDRRTKSGDDEMLENMHRTKRGRRWPPVCRLRAFSLGGSGSVWGMRCVRSPNRCFPSPASHS